MVAGGLSVLMVAAAAQPSWEHDSDSAFELTSAGPGAFEAPNPAHGFHTYFSRAGVRVVPLPEGTPAWAVELRPRMARAGLTELSQSANRLDYGFSSLRASFVNGKRGLEQAYALSEPGGSLDLDLRLEGNLTPKVSEESRGVDLFFGDRLALRFGELRASDALGRDIPASMELSSVSTGEGPLLRLALASTDAVYPVTVELLITSPQHGHRTGFSMDTDVDRVAAFVAPPNDTCGGAEVIPGAGPFPHSTAVTANVTDATTTGDPPSPSCQDILSRSIWYTFTPSVTQTYLVSTCANAPTGTTLDDTVIGIYTSGGGCAGPFTEVASGEATNGCDDDTCINENLQALVVTRLNAATTYYIVVWKFATSPPAPGNTAVQLRVGPVAPPPNDSCGSAVAIPPVGPFPHLAAEADVLAATTTGDPLFCTSPVTNTVWYTFTPGSSATYLISTCHNQAPGTTVPDTVLGVYTAPSCAGPFSSVACNDQDVSCGAGTLQSTITTPLNAGTTYYIVAGSFNSPTPHTSKIQLSVDQVFVPSNDKCEAAQSLLLDTPASGSTVLAVDDYHSPGNVACYAGLGQATSTAGGHDVVYGFTAPGAGSYSFRVTDYNGGNPVLYVASDCPSTPPAATVACLGGANRNVTGTAEEVMCLALADQQQVYVYVDENTVTTGTTFTVEVNRCVREIEANGTTASANALACPVELSVSPAGDIDFFSLGSPPAGHRVFAMVDAIASNAADTQMRVTDSVNTLEFEDDDGDTRFGGMGFEPAAAGTLMTGVPAFIRMNPFSPGTTSEPHRLYSVVQKPIATATPESEPNGTPAQADTAANGYYTGTLAGPPTPSTDVDVFALDAQQGDLIFVGLDADPNKDGTNIDGALALLDAGGAVLLSVDSPHDTTNGYPAGPSPGPGLSGTTPGFPAEGLVFRARYTGTYYARVAISPGATASNGQGDYLLSVSLDCQPTDLDADGVINAQDCAPLDPTAFAVPAEATGLVLSKPNPLDRNETRLTWTSAGGGSGTAHDVLRGGLAAFPVGPGGGDEQCLTNNLAATTLTDSTPQASRACGGACFYVVRGDNACGKGTYGNERRNTGGPPASIPRTSTTCP